jgi:hypothetical protein
MEIENILAFGKAIKFKWQCNFFYGFRFHFHCFELEVVAHAGVALAGNFFCNMYRWES